MTFEEFLIKKKIDPDRLQNADQDFFNEFKSHFNQMGEKSFDHSKKFWFNKLRRANPLAEVEKQAEALVKQIETSGKQTEALEVSSDKHKSPSVTLEKSTEVQEKQAVATGKQTEALEVKSDNHKSPSPSTETAKPAFKPRFKATPKPLEESQDSKGETAPQQEIVEPKSAYKPRFRAGVVKKGDGEE